MNSFKDENQKQELLAQLKHHQELDAFVQGQWLQTDLGKIEGNGFKGCFYGCTMQTESSPREAFSEKYQIDLWYCYLTEKIFEGLPKGEFEKFPYESIEIIPVGFNFNKAKSRFFWLQLEDQKKFAGENKQVLDSIIQCQKLFEVDFDKIDESAAWSAESAAESAWSAAESAARSARSAAESARSAAWSAAWSARSAAESAAESAWSAAESARSAAESAAESAAARSAAARSAARSAYYVFLRDILFQAINETK